MSSPIPGLKLIHHNAGRINEPDDPSLPFKLELSLSPPQFMIISFIGLYGGSEEIVVRAKTREALEEFLEQNQLRRHPRLRSLTITGPDGCVEGHPKEKSPVLQA